MKTVISGDEFLPLAVLKELVENKFFLVVKNVSFCREHWNDLMANRPKELNLETPFDRVVNFTFDVNETNETVITAEQVSGFYVKFMGYPLLPILTVHPGPSAMDEEKWLRDTVAGYWKITDPFVLQHADGTFFKSFQEVDHGQVIHVVPSGQKLDP